MKPAKLDLPIIWRGCDYPAVTLTWKDQNGNPINLLGWRPKARSLNIDLKPVITNASGGVTVISLTKTDTAALKLGVESWDWVWERISPPYRYPPFLSGRVEVKESLTGNNGA